ncbi:MAG: MBL fold metallo-hydrolase [Candidatus Helarchaeota archaeon]
MKIVKDRGMHIISKKIHVVIDPTTIKSANESDLVLISHAHGDHIKNVEKILPLKVMSQPTYDLLSLKLKENSIIKNFRIITPYETPQDELNIHGCKISAHHAGHCVGSLQFKIKIENKNVVYTGDFCLESRFGMNKAPLLKSKNGILITDDTYFSQQFIFPSRKALYPKILSWFNDSFREYNELIVIAQRLGVQQEMTALLNYSTLKCNLYTHPLVYKTNEVHSNYVPLGKFQYKNKFLPKTLKDKKLTSFFETEKKRYFYNKINSKSIFLLPYFYIRKLRELKEKFGKTSIVVATGWAKSQNFGVKSFPLSSHAGYDQILKYQKNSQAQKTYFF